MNRFLNPPAFGFQPFETSQVLSEDWVGLDTVLQAAQLQVQFRRSLVRQPVDHPFLMALCHNQSVRPQVSQMFRDRYLGQFQYVLEMTDAQRPLSQ
jgi:hypothetical protein